MSKNLINIEKIFNNYIQYYHNDNFNIHIWNSITFELIDDLNITDNNTLISNKYRHINTKFSKPYYYINDKYKDILLKDTTELKITFIYTEVLIHLWENNFILSSIYEDKIIIILKNILENIKKLQYDNDLYNFIQLWINYLFSIKSKSFSTIINSYLKEYFEALINNYNNLYYIDENCIITNDIELINKIKSDFIYVDVNNMDCILTDIKKYIFMKNNEIIKMIGY